MGRPEAAPAEPASPWESTGFISDLSWATGLRLTPCLAFRGEGAYKVRIARLGGPPPSCLLIPDLSPGTANGMELGWSGMDWEADPTADAAATMAEGLEVLAVLGMGGNPGDVMGSLGPAGA